MITHSSTGLPTAIFDEDGNVKVNGRKVRAIRLATASRSLTRTGRRTRYMSQEELAQHSHLSRSYIAEIESGVKRPRYHAAEAIASALGTDLESLVGS